MHPQLGLPPFVFVWFCLILFSVVPCDFFVADRWLRSARALANKAPWNWKVNWKRTEAGDWLLLSTQPTAAAAAAAGLRRPGTEKKRQRRAAAVGVAGCQCRPGVRAARFRGDSISSARTQIHNIPHSREKKPQFPAHPWESRLTAGGGTNGSWSQLESRIQRRHQGVGLFPEPGGGSEGTDEQRFTQRWGQSSQERPWD